MLRKELEFCELLCAKFCHDLSGPIGAINNGIDFLDSDNENMKEKAADLVKLSSNQAVNRLAFFRQAYGFLGVNNEITLTQLKSLLDKFVQDSKIELAIDPGMQTDFQLDPTLGKIILNLIIISSNIILLNGKIQLVFEQLNGPKIINILASGPVAKIDEELIEILTGDNRQIPITTRNVQHFYTRYLLNCLGAEIKVDNSKTGINLTLKTE